MNPNPVLVSAMELGAGAVTTAWNSCGEKMAVGFADGSIEIFQCGESPALSHVFKWKAHEGSIVKLAWGPLEYGDVVASCSKDGRIVVWEEISDAGHLSWRECAQLSDSANSIALDLKFGNPLSGLKLLVATADGYVRIYETLDSIELKHWQLQAHFPNVTDVNVTEAGKCSCPCSAASISWRPPVGSIQQAAFTVGFTAESPKFSSAKVWQFAEVHQRWYSVAQLATGDETQGVAAVSWAPNIGRAHETIAVASGNSVAIWRFELNNSEKAAKVAALDHPAEVRHLDWDMSGMTLATTARDGVVRLWQSGLDGIWRRQASVEGSK